jgi:predicted PurR-regulated permease PerM
MILLSMIPMAGSAIVWVPAALYLLSTGHWGKALALTLWGILVIGTIDNILRPKLVGNRVRLHELVVFFAVLGGIQVFGVLGVVTGPALAAIAIALLDVWKQARVAPQ